MGVVEQLQHLAPHLGRTVGLVEVDADGLAGVGRQLAHPWPFVDRHARVIGSELEHAVTHPADGRADAQQLARIGVRPGHELAVLRAVQRCSAGREPQRTGAQRAVDQRRHVLDVVVARRLVGGTAVAHDEAAQGSVGDLRSDVDHAWLGGQRVEVLGVAGPLPRDALDHRAAGDVLDPLHQLDQPLVSICCGGCEADAAVAHDHRGDPVPTRGCQPRVPRGLRVVVRVHIDEAGSHQQAVGVDGPARCRPGAGRLDRHDPVAVDADIGRRRGSSRSVDEQPVADDQVAHPVSVADPPAARRGDAAGRSS
jgi:hypothetical protein